ncbi:Nudix family hydrolase [Methylonatrum kenyense]|nr:Nudix family hydrolase [Methylonatrum kenyense]MCK8516302.1 Nudix family hydrolase [Methylonatrum kenyense]
MAPVVVAAGVIQGPDSRFLVSQRPRHLHQGGLWEFPGGKLEAGESAFQALQRELSEELGIRVRQAEPLIRVPWRYPDKTVVLHVWRVTGFDGEPEPREGQAMRWVDGVQLAALRFPAANQPIVTAARLPDRYLITPEPAGPVDGFLAALDRAVANGIDLIQLRARSLDDAAYARLAEQVVAHLGKRPVQLLLNAQPSLAVSLGVGLHLSARRLRALATRPRLAPGQWLAASCHSTAELWQAVHKGVDFAVLGPVLPTRSHPEAGGIGFDRLHALLREVPLPTYALGGLDPTHLDTAKAHGAQGIAAIRGLWPPGPRKH